MTRPPRDTDIWQPLNDPAENADLLSPDDPPPSDQTHHEEAVTPPAPAGDAADFAALLEALAELSDPGTSIDHMPLETYTSLKGNLDD